MNIAFGVEMRSSYTGLSALSSGVIRLAAAPIAKHSTIIREMTQSAFMTSAFDTLESMEMQDTTMVADMNTLITSLLASLMNVLPRLPVLTLT